MASIDQAVSVVAGTPYEVLFYIYVPEVTGGGSCTIDVSVDSDDLFDTEFYDPISTYTQASTYFDADSDAITLVFTFSCDPDTVSYLYLDDISITEAAICTPQGTAGQRIDC